MKKFLAITGAIVMMASIAWAGPQVSGSGGIPTTVIDALTSTSSTSALSAGQEKVLNDGKAAYDKSIPSAAAGGTVDAITADYTPNVTLTNEPLVSFVSAGANTSTTPSFCPDSCATPRTIVKAGGAALVAGDIGAAGFVGILQYNLANTRWELLNALKPSGSLNISALDMTSATSSIPQPLAAPGSIPATCTQGMKWQDTTYGFGLNCAATNTWRGSGLLSVTTVALNADAETTIFTVPTGKRCVLSHAILVVGADAGTTTISIGQDTAETDFLGNQTLSGLNAAYDAAILMPVPNATPVLIKSYAAGTLIKAAVGSQAGGATNTLYLFGILY